MPDEDEQPTFNVLSVALQVIGAGAALVSWIVVVGGGIMWARFDAAGVPDATRAVTLMPRDSLIAEGIHALGLAMIVAAAIALVVLLLGLNPDVTQRIGYRAGSTAATVWNHLAVFDPVRLFVVTVLLTGLVGAVIRVTPLTLSGSGWPLLLVPAILLCLVLGLRAIHPEAETSWVEAPLIGVLLIGSGIVTCIYIDVEFEGLLTFAALVVWVLAVGALALVTVRSRDDRQPVLTAAIVFAVLIVLSGAWQFVQRRSDKTPSFERTRAVLKDGHEIRGLLLGQVGDRLALICTRPVNQQSGDAGSYVLVISIKDAQRLVFRSATDVRRPTTATTCEAS
jgi:hypothetical protein